MYVAPRGLISILLFFAIPESQLIADFNPTIFLIVIIGSNLVMTYGLMKFQGEGESEGEGEGEGESEGEGEDEVEMSVRGTG